MKNLRAAFGRTRLFSIPVIRSPVRGFPGYPAAEITTHTDGSDFHVSFASERLPFAALYKSVPKTSAEPMHQRLRFRIAEAHVELDHLGPIGRHHQSRVEKAGEAGRAHRRLNDGVENSLSVSRSYDAPIAVSAHASGVRARVAVVDGFVILRCFERNHVAPVADHDEADFLAL